MSKPAAILRFVVIAGAVLALDLAVKYASFRYVAGTPVSLSRQAAKDHAFWAQYPHDAITLVPYGLALHLTTNTGAVFGLGKGSQWFFVGVTFVAVAVIVRVFLTSPVGAKGLHVCLAMILAGAVGNLYDRLRYNAVRDMLKLFPEVHLPMGWSWPGGETELYPWIFNVADASLMIGVFTLLLITWRGEKPRRAGDTRAS